MTKSKKLSQRMLAGQQAKITVFFILIIICSTSCHRDHSSVSLQPTKVEPNELKIDREFIVAYFLDKLNWDNPPPNDGILRLARNAVMDEIASRSCSTTTLGITLQPEALLIGSATETEQGIIYVQLVFSVLFNPEEYDSEAIEKTFSTLDSSEKIVHSVEQSTVGDEKPLLSPIVWQQRQTYSTGPNGAMTMTMSGDHSTWFDMRQTDHGCAVGVFSVSMKAKKDRLIVGDRVRIFLSPQKIAALYNRMNRGMPRVTEQHIHSLPSELQAYPYRYVTSPSVSSSNRAPWP